MHNAIDEVLENSEMTVVAQVSKINQIMESYNFEPLLRYCGGSAGSNCLVYRNYF